jgi:hypothetical protein
MTDRASPRTSRHLEEQERDAKLSWVETYRQMAAETEDWSEQSLLATPHGHECPSY